MKRVHVNLSVNALEPSVAFYTALFGSAPTVLKTDYAKWMLEDPRLNFSLSLKPGEGGLEHLGIQTESDEELKEVYTRMHKAEGSIREEGKTICCYAQSEKSWIKDPQGIEWEAFYTFGESAVNRQESLAEAACCSSTQQEAACCSPS